jgi:tetratricopeptide (TPR) repeat protein
MTAARAALRRDERFVPAMIAIIKASIARGRTELANAVLDQALAVNADDAELHYLRGKLYLEEDGRLRDALREFRRAVELRGDYVEARMALGMQLLIGANYDEALAHFQAASRLAPTLVEVQLALGDAYRANKQWENAKNVFTRVLRMRPNTPEAHYNMALMYMTAGGEFPGLDQLQALRKAQEEFTAYRNAVGPRIERDVGEQLDAYLEDIGRQIEREQRRIEREKAGAAREAERAARAGGDAGAAATAPDGG